jgi:hypothetical protein
MKTIPDARQGEVIIVTDGRGMETESRELAVGMDGDSGVGVGVDGVAMR